MGYLIFRGVSTEDLGNVYVSRMPSHKKASVRMTEYYVKGRDGALHVNEGYANFDIQVTLVLLNADAEKRQIVNAWADGTGKLITSDDLTKAYKATVVEGAEWTRVEANDGFYDSANITFNCEPFMYEAEETAAVFTESGTLTNPGSATAFPLIKVEGSGDVSFVFAGSTIRINGVTSGVPVFIDCENGYVYTASGAATMVGDIPELGLGSNYVVFGSGVSRITVNPHWRWV